MEYLVDFNNMVELAKDYDLKLVKDYNFLKYYDRYKDDYKYRKIFQKISKLNIRKGDEYLDEKLLKISQVYKIAIFEKKRGPSMYKNITKRYFYHCDRFDELTVLKKEKKK